MKISEGSTDLTGIRLPKEIRTYEFLDSLGVPYVRADHEPAMTMEDCAAVENALMAPVCKNLFLCNRQQTEFYLLLIPGDKVFKTKDISAQINSSRLSFGSAEYMKNYLDITPGSLSVLGLMNDKNNCVTLLIDRDVFDTEYLVCHPCINTSSVKISVTDMKDKIIPALNHAPVFVTL